MPSHHYCGTTFLNMHKDSSQPILTRANKRSDNVQRVLSHHDHHCTYTCVESYHTINTKWNARANAVSLREPSPGGYGFTDIGEQRFLHDNYSGDSGSSGPIGERVARQVIIERMLAQIHDTITSKTSFVELSSPDRTSGSGLCLLTPKHRRYD